MEIKRPRELKPTQLLVLSFSSIIFVGTILLLLPQATVGDSLSLVDALFTATSATCVTGLIVVDTGTKFTPFGQGVILTLIQIGGLGIMTFSTFFLFLFGKRISFREREIVSETLIPAPMRDIASLLKRVFKVTLILEGIGFLLLIYPLSRTLPLKKALYHALFHSVSAFCNAGFCLYKTSFIEFQGDILVNLTLISLIILGGVGFIVLIDLGNFFGNRRKGNPYSFTFHTKVVLTATAILILIGSTGFFLLEAKNSLRASSPVEKVLISLFQSVTPRTTGFNTVDIGHLTNSTLFLLIILMFIGASPGSCGGGIKVSTFAVLIALAIAKLRGREEVHLFYRRIPPQVISKAVAIVFTSITVIILVTLILQVTELGYLPHPESKGAFLETFFEVVSAFGTVGLSTGITPKLSTLGRILITIVMFVGRLGPLTVALAVAQQKPRGRFKYVTEEIMVG